MQDHVYQQTHDDDALEESEVKVELSEEQQELLRVTLQNQARDDMRNQAERLGLSRRQLERTLGSERARGGVKRRRLRLMEKKDWGWDGSGWVWVF